AAPRRTERRDAKLRRAQCFGWRPTESFSRNTLVEEAQSQSCRSGIIRRGQLSKPPKGSMLSEIFRTLPFRVTEKSPRLSAEVTTRRPKFGLARLVPIIIPCSRLGAKSKASNGM